MGKFYAYAQAVKSQGLACNKRFSTTSLDRGQDTPDQLMQPPEAEYMPYGIIDFATTLKNTGSTTATPNSKVAGATTDVADLWMNRLELKDAVGGQQRSLLKNRVDIEEMERITFNLPAPVSGLNGYNLPGLYPRNAPPTIAPGATKTVYGSIQFPWGSLGAGEGCYVVFGFPLLSTVYPTADDITVKDSVAYREVYHPDLPGAWAWQSVKPSILGPQLQDVAAYFPLAISPDYVDFTHATVTTTSTSSTNTFDQSLFQAPGLNELQDNIQSIIRSSLTGYPDVATRTPNYGTVANCLTDTVLFSTKGKRPSIWNIDLLQQTALDMLMGEYKGPAGSIPSGTPSAKLAPADIEKAAPHVQGAGPTTVQTMAGARRVA